MKLKSFLYCLLLFSALKASAQEVYIYGKFLSALKTVKVEDISEFQYLQPQDEKLSVKKDTGGNFSIRFNLKKPGYYRVGRNILYLSPGNRIKVLINHLNPELSSFEGTGSIANSYLKDTPFPKGGSYLESGKNIVANPQSQLDNILSLSKARQYRLQRLKGVSERFKELETARIRADVINSIKSLSYYAPRKLKLNAEMAKTYLDDFNSAAAPVVRAYLPQLRNPELLQLVVFRDIAPILLKNSEKLSEKDAAALSKIKDWIRADSLVQMMVSTEEKAKIRAFSGKLKTIKSLNYQQAAFRMLHKMMQYGIGDAAVDFSATDINGNQVNLADLKGKVIFIDLWATWCGPCLAEMPAFEKLRQQYAGNKEIAFISLSIDDNPEGWKKNVNSRKASGLQWQINRNALQDYRVANIPRTIIIDKKFRIANFQAPVPSSETNIELLNRLLTADSKTDKFNINGKFSSADTAGILFLTYEGNNNRIIRDSVKLKNGAFHFEGSVAETTQANLLLSHAGYYVVKKNSDQTDIYLSNNKVLTITAKDSIANADVTGDEENLANQQFKRRFDPLQKAQRALLYLLTPENRANAAFMKNISNQNKTLVLKQKNLQQKFIAEHPDLMASLSFLKAYAGPVMDLDEIRPLYEGLALRVKQSQAGTEFAELIEKLSASAVGQQAPDFTLPDADGKQVGLSDFKGKYLLLDFWASWCAPCRAENPNVVAQYNKYKQHNFEVLSVSLDSKNAKNAWLRAIKDDGLVWKNLSGLNGFESIAAKRYHIQAIPQNFLIDPSGKIIARNLRGTALEDALKKFLK